jgi:3-(3-hydroxy-phenyl)propionate hydroxylase
VSPVGTGASVAQAAPPGTVIDTNGLVAERYDLLPGTVLLFRPDQHVCARWRRATPEAVRNALKRALAIT